MQCCSTGEPPRLQCYTAMLHCSLTLQSYTGGHLKLAHRFLSSCAAWQEMVCNLWGWEPNEQGVAVGGPIPVVVSVLFAAVFTPGVLHCRAPSASAVARHISRRTVWPAAKLLGFGSLPSLYINLIMKAKQHNLQIIFSPCAINILLHGVFIHINARHKRTVTWRFEVWRLYNLADLVFFFCHP